MWFRSGAGDWSIVRGDLPAPFLPTALSRETGWLDDGAGVAEKGGTGQLEVRVGTAGVRGGFVVWVGAARFVERGEAGSEVARGSC